MATTRNTSTDEEFDVFVSPFTDDDEEDDDSCSNETEDDDIRLPTDHSRHESPASTITSGSLVLGQQNINHVSSSSSSTNTKKFSIASILGNEGDGHTLSEYENKHRQDEGGTFVRPTPISAVIRPPSLNAAAAAAAVALYPGAFLAHQNPYNGPASNSAGLMLEMISPSSLSCSSEHPNSSSAQYSSLPYPASLASASAASLLYGGWFSASAASKSPTQIFGLQGNVILFMCISVD
jgi:hypothetical protein